MPGWLYLLLPILLLPRLAIASEPDWSAYADLLEHYVAPGDKHGIAVNLVDYQGLSGEARFAEVVEDVRGFDVALLASREERLAFYINAYNILTIRLILDNWPVDSIKDIGNFLRGPWDRVVLENGDGRLTLDGIEKDILRPMGEPRIHFAINCASVSCPDLRREPYEAAILDRQLDDQARGFLANAGKGLVASGDRIRVSRIFDWYEDDFETPDGVDGFIRRYRPELEFRRLKANLRYDWSLNGKKELDNTLRK
jgi:hypothetical protein